MPSLQQIIELVYAQLHQHLQEKLDADRSKRKRVELEESVRQEKEIVAQMRRAAANTSDQSSEQASDRPRLKIDERGDGEGLELRIAQASGGERRVHFGDVHASIPEGSKAFRKLEERAAAGSATSAGVAPVRKKTKVCESWWCTKCVRCIMSDMCVSCRAALLHQQWLQADALQASFAWSIAALAGMQ